MNIHIGGLYSAGSLPADSLVYSEIAPLLAGVIDAESKEAIRKTAELLFSKKLDPRVNELIMWISQKAPPEERAGFFATVASLFLKIDSSTSCLDHFLGEIREAVYVDTQSLIEHAEYLYRDGLAFKYPFSVLHDILKSLSRTSPVDRQDVAVQVKPLLKSATGHRDMCQLIDAVAQIPREERAPLIAHVVSLVEGHSDALRVTTLEALLDVPKEKREQLVVHIKSFIDGHEIESFDLSDVIYALVKIAPDQRESVVNQAKPLLKDVKSGVARCEMLRAIDAIPAEEREEVIALCKPLFQYFKDPLSWAYLISSAAAVPHEERKDVLEKSIPMLPGLYDGSHVHKIFSAVTAIAVNEREAVIAQAMPLLQETNAGWYRGQSLRAIAETAPQERDALICQARRLLSDKYWWNDSIATFLRIVATTAPEELEVVLCQARAISGNTRLGDRVELLRALTQIQADQRVDLIEEIQPLLAGGGVDNSEVAEMLRECAAMEQEPRQSLIQQTAFLINERDPQGRLALFQAVQAIPSLPPAVQGILEYVYRDGRNSDMAEAIEMCSERHDVLPTLEEILAFWTEAAKDAAVTAPAIHFEQHQDQVLEFLARLKDTGEYKNENVRTLLAKRVIQAFGFMAENEEIKAQAVDIIFDAVISCNDGIIAALDQIELMIQIYSIEHSDYAEEKLRKLAKSFLLLDMVNEKVTEYIKTLSCDEIENRLAVQIVLADRFELPIQTRNMLFREGYVKLTDEAIAQFGDEIEKSCTEEKVAEHLETWGPWKDYQRRKVPSYNSLKTVVRVLEDDRCPISQATPANPVLYNSTVYDYDAFIQWYRASGSDPMGSGQNIDLQNLQRIVPEGKNEQD